jgi:hypothetical protein
MATQWQPSGNPRLHRSTGEDEKEIDYTSDAD